MWQERLSDVFTQSGQRLFWVYLLSSLLIALIFTLFQILKNPAKKWQWQTFKAYLLHPSALLDYRYFFVGSFIKVLFIAPLVISAKSVAIFVVSCLQAYIDQPITSLSKQTIIFLYTLSLFLVSDCSRYFLHRLLHRSPYLWRFHQVHHSAQVLNPLSFYRVHPVENFLFGLRYTLCTGIVTGIFLSLFGPRLQLWTILGANAFLFIFSFLGTHLRHSHLYISYPIFLEKWFISPAMHQVHHYQRYTHCNYGGYLAIWDYVFGSWISSHTVTAGQPMGLSEKQAPYFQSVRQLLLQPFFSFFKRKRF